MNILHIHKEGLQKQVVALEGEVRRLNEDLQRERSAVSYRLCSFVVR